MKVTDKLMNKEINWSFEFFPPKTAAGKQNLFKRLQNMKSLGPTFSDITWGSSGSTSELSLEIAEYMFKVLGMETSLHITCTNMKTEILTNTLNSCQQMGLRNILALRGDPPKFDKDYFNQKEDLEFCHAIDLVKFIRFNYGDYFCIGVAGYPEGHIDSPDLASDLHHLKSKVDSGADYIVTQLFYDTALFLKFVKECRAIGITCPILPGMMPIQNYNGFMRMTSLCKTFVPEQIKEDLFAIKEDDALVKEYGVELAVNMCKQMMHHDIKNFHFYTLNLSTSTRLILEKLQFVPLYEHVKPLPWSKSLASNRENESVRPIYWSNRIASYIQRTATWDEFPNGRWGNSDSAAYGELDGYGSQLKMEKNACIEMWGHPSNKTDLSRVFADFCLGKIRMLPWCDEWNLESVELRQLLEKVNLNGFLTINSQPSVNGVRSDSKVHGWGPKNGYVYQRSYVEFFVDQLKLKSLIPQLEQDEQITYYCIDSNGLLKTNHEYDEPIALTWGLFPGKEVMQPTIMQKDALLAWKDEAFELWKEWRDIYEIGSDSWEMLNNIREKYALVTVVHNDFTVSADELFKHFKNKNNDSSVNLGD
eukprot:NODE_598_length_6262_cov_0.141652.p1 type:complete len:591 gc:universal NODE_598_length_6262_cov_0.141652:3280-5052(+)